MEPERFEFGSRIENCQFVFILSPEQEPAFSKKGWIPNAKQPNVAQKPLYNGS
jgi:hypothetical protein